MLSSTFDSRKILERNPSIVVSTKEIQDAYMAYLSSQFNHYFHTAMGAKPGEAAPAFVEEDSLFEAEHVDGILRYLIGKDPRLANTVGIFPTFNPDAFFRQACDTVVNKIKQDPRFKKLVKDPTPLIEVSDCAGFPDLLAQRNAEERFRDQQDNEANEHAKRILSENGITRDNLFALYLQAIVNGENTKLGNKTNPHLPLANCTQFIIPIRQNNHYTVAVANCDVEESSANIEYYNSFGSDLNENDKNQLVIALCDMGFDNVEFDCVSERQQKEGDGHNCGLFAAFKGFDLAAENTGSHKRVLEGFEKEYDAFFRYLRNRATEMLRESGCNIALSEELVALIKQDQAERDSKEDKDSTLTWMYKAATSLFNSSVKRAALDDLSDDDEPMTLIADKQWNKPSALLQSCAEEAQVEILADTAVDTPKSKPPRKKKRT